MGRLSKFFRNLANKLDGLRPLLLVRGRLRHPTFHRIFSRAVRLDLRWDTALRDFQIQLGSRVSRNEARALDRYASLGGLPASIGDGALQANQKLHSHENSIPIY